MRSFDLVAPRDIFNRANFEFNITTLMRAVQCNVVSNIVFDAELYKEVGIQSSVDCENNMELLPCLFYKRSTMEPLLLKRGSNSRERYTLYLELEDDEVIDVFTSNGELSLEFNDYLGECDTPESLQSNDCFTAAASRANFLKLVGKVALNSVNEVLVGLEFDQERYATEDIVVSTSYGYYEIQNDLFSVNGQSLCLSLDVHLTVGNFLVFWDVEDENYYKVFNEEGKFTDDFLTYVKQPEKTWHAVQS